MDRKVYCANCGRENSVENNCCLFCGSKLIKPATDQIGTAQPTPAQTRRKKGMIIILGIILLALIGTLLMVYMSSKSNAEYNSKIDEGDQYMQALEYDKAETSYLAAIEIKPKEEKAYLKVADLYIDQKQYEEAETILLRGQKETNAALIAKKLGQVQPYRLYDTYLSETLASKVGFADVDKNGTVNDIKQGLISAVAEDFNYDGTPDFLTVSCKNNEKATLTISLYTCKKGKVVLLEEKTEDHASPDDSFSRHDVFLKQNKDSYYLVIGTEGLFSSGGYWITRIYQIETDITQVCDADFSQDIGSYYYGLNGEDVAAYEVEDIDDMSETEVAAVNEKGTSVLSAALEAYGFDSDRSIETNEDGQRITQLECDEKDASEQKICDIQKGEFGDEGVDFLKSENFYILDYTGLQGPTSSSIDQNKESDDGKSQKNSASILNEDAAMEYALDYARYNGKLDGIGNVGAMCDGVEDNEYTIRIYEDMEDHIATILQWSVSKDGDIYDLILDEWVHKEN